MILMRLYSVKRRELLSASILSCRKIFKQTNKWTGKMQAFSGLDCVWLMLK